jgi:hypothetical protein
MIIEVCAQYGQGFYLDLHAPNVAEKVPRIMSMQYAGTAFQGMWNKEHASDPCIG